MKSSHYLYIPLQLFLVVGIIIGGLLSCRHNPTGAELPPEAPQALEPTAVYNQFFTAHWTQVVEADGYRLDVATDSLFANYHSGYQDKDVGRADSAIVSSLTAGASYYYRVRAVNRYGTSITSNRMHVVTYPAGWNLNAPRVVDATDITATAFTANWYAPMNPYQGYYYLIVSTDSLFSASVPGYSYKYVGNNLQARVNGLRPVTTYYYQVWTASSRSNYISATTQAGPGEIPAATPATQVTETSFRANWTVHSGALSYRLDVAKDSLFSSFVPGYLDKDVGATSGAEVTGLQSSSIYYYRVRAVYSGGVTDNSNTIWVIVALLKDVFPLAKGAQFRYAYFDTLLERSGGMPSRRHLDSGYVEYRVIDSVTTADSRCHWTIEEYRHFYHEEYWFRSDYTWQPVRVGWIDTTVTLDLVEDLWGLQELYCAGSVWAFPLVPSNPPPATPPVYRLSLSARSPVVLRMGSGGEYNGPGFKDSLMFVADSGLTYRLILKSGVGTMSGPFGKKECRLVWSSNLPPRGSVEALLTQSRRSWSRHF